MIRSLLQIGFLATLVSLMALPSLTLAQNGATGETETIQLEAEELNDETSFDVGDLLSTDNQDQAYLNDEKNSPVVAFILDIINFFTRIIGAITMVLIIVGGLLMIVSQGNDDRVQQGKGILEAAIIGLIIVMFSYIIVRFVQSIFYIQQ